MTPQEIILACTHREVATSEVNLTDGRVVVCCCECWNASVYARRAAQKADNDARAAKGAAWWAEQGIKVGDKVYRTTRHMLNPLVAVRVEGVAKTGARGAYVSSKWQKGYLSPEGWEKA